MLYHAASFGIHNYFKKIDKIDRIHKMITQTNPTSRHFQWFVKNWYRFAHFLSAFLSRFSTPIAWSVVSLCNEEKQNNSQIHIQCNFKLFLLWLSSLHVFIHIGKTKRHAKENTSNFIARIGFAELLVLTSGCFV